MNRALRRGDGVGGGMQVALPPVTYLMQEAILVVSGRAFC
jgi:hypothetical protein